MAKEAPIFNDIKHWIDMMCRIYTREELQMFGRLGFDIAHHETFAKRYMEELMKIREEFNPDKKFRFSKLNERIYGIVMSDINNSPDWIRDAAKAENLAQLKELPPFKRRLVDIYRRSRENQAKIVNMKIGKSSEK